ncbi:hypothetical protein [Pseudaminobacter sp. NGMCC 1.201702]|uniref:hypothetical protein n=1 Tax=Pseudaminobacter sp. NGMCC 1.201702 TaxID=3391825 RepID=UPI0039EEE70C
MEAMHLQRQWDLEDRAEARAYAEAHPQVVRSEVDYDKMVKEAASAGFNPLTVLRNGGSAGFSLSSSNAAEAPLSRRAPVLQATEGAGGAIGDSLMSIGNSFLSNFDPFADQKREAEYELVQAQIRNLNASTANLTARPSRSFNVPSYTAGAVERRPSGKAAALSASMGKPQTPTLERPSVTNPWRDMDVNPKLMDAETFEARYGDSELASTAWFLRNLGGDIAYNIQHKTLPEFQRGWKDGVKVTPVPKSGTWWDYVPSFDIRWR